jgi:hypothetical protein
MRIVRPAVGVCALALVAGSALALSFSPVLRLPLARRADRAELILVGADTFLLPREASGRGIAVSGVRVDTVLAGLAQIRARAGASDRVLQVGWLGPRADAPREAGGRSRIWFLHHAAGGWAVLYGFDPMAAPRTANEAADLVDSLHTFDAVPGSAGRTALLRYLQSQAERLPVAPGARFRNVRVVSGK